MNPDKLEHLRLRRLATDGPLDDASQAIKEKLGRDAAAAIDLILLVALNEVYDAAVEQRHTGRVAELLQAAARYDDSADQLNADETSTEYRWRLASELRTRAAGNRCEALVLQLQDWSWPKYDFCPRCGGRGTLPPAPGQGSIAPACEGCHGSGRVPPCGS